MITDSKEVIKLGRYLRPRRGNENAATEANIKLWEGEIFLEYPKDRGIGRSPGRIIIGNGNDVYTEKENVTDDPSKFQPFITDPSLYVPLYEESEPKENYKYEDEDRGTSIFTRWVIGIKSLPETIGYIRKILCEHTDNLKYDNYRINRLEEGGSLANVADIRIVKKVVTPAGYNSSIRLDGDDIGEGYEFSHWINVSADGRTSNPVYIQDTTNINTYIYTFNGTFNPIPYVCSAMYIKKNNVY